MDEGNRIGSKPFDQGNFAGRLLKAHDQFIREHKRGAFWQYSRFYEEVNDTLDKAILRTGLRGSHKGGI